MYTTATQDVKADRAPKRGDNVWIKLCGKWFPGRIWGHRVLKGQTRDGKVNHFVHHAPIDTVH